MTSGRNVSMCPHRSFLEYMNNAFCMARCPLRVETEERFPLSKRTERFSEELIYDIFKCFLAS